MKTPRHPFTCPVCGEEVSPNAKACPECGSCDKSGWSGDSSADGLDLPDEDDFDYEKFVTEEFGGTPKKTGQQWLWWLVAVVLLLAFAVLLFSH